MTIKQLPRDGKLPQSARMISLMKSFLKNHNHVEGNSVLKYTMSKKNLKSIGIVQLTFHHLNR